MTTETQKIPHGYKQTEIGVIPADWDVKELGELVDVKDGTHQTPKYFESGIPFYSVESVTNNDFVNTKYISLSEHKTLTKKFKIEKMDILMTRIGSIGDCKLITWEPNASFYVSLALLKPKDKSISLYIYHFSKSKTFRKELEDRSLMWAIPKKINLGEISKVKVYIPKSKPEQTAIATALSDADELIEKIERLIKKKKNIKQGAMQELLTEKRRLPGFSGKWETKKIGDIGKTYGGLSGKVKGDFGVGNSFYIPFMNIMSNPIIDPSYLDSVNIRSDEYQNKAQKGDLFFNGSSETPEEVGMCSVLQTEIPNLYLNSFCFGFRLYQELKTDGLFFSYYFRSSAGRELIFSLAQGATRYNLSKTNFVKLEIPYPKPKEQTAIASVLSDMDAEIEKLESSLLKYKNIKQGMMQQLLTGKIRIYATT
ncbi:MAG: restriction endonuclease subunit S [Candidatus Latescibacterota bacterium]|jgi:type I restriction enzyme S subunit